MSALGAPGADSSQANGINTSGQAVGTAFTILGAQAGVWTDGLFSNLGTLGGSNSYGMAINDAGSAAGSASLASGDAHAFLFRNGKMSDLGTLGNTSWSSGYGINKNNQVVGYSTTMNGGFHAFRWSESTGMADLGTLGGSSYGMGINDNGDVVGASAAPTGFLHAFVWSGGAMQDLGTLGGTSSFAYGINSSGQIVGYSYIPESENSRAFLWMAGGLLDLNSLLPSDSGWELNAAYAINDNGQIAGMGTYQGELRAFRLDPQDVTRALEAFSEAAAIPEPGTLTLLGAGAALLAASIRARGRRLS
jgi:probable HAF family extracellular repeat protein